jgi:hypothetical protein
MTYQKEHQSSSGMTWSGWSTFINYAATITAIGAMIPGINVVAGPLAVITGVAAAITNGVNSYNSFRQGHYLAGSMYLVGALFDAGGAAVGVKALGAMAAEEEAAQATRTAFDSYWGSGMSRTDEQLAGAADAVQPLARAQFNAEEASAAAQQVSNNVTASSLGITVGSMFGNVANGKPWYQQ